MKLFLMKAKHNGEDQYEHLCHCCLLPCQNIEIIHAFSCINITRSRGSCMVERGCLKRQVFKHLPRDTAILLLQ